MEIHRQNLTYVPFLLIMMVVGSRKSGFASAVAVDSSTSSRRGFVLNSAIACLAAGRWRSIPLHPCLFAILNQINWNQLIHVNLPFRV